jgi:hypothetical protein
VAVAQREQHAQLVQVNLALVDAVDLLVLRHRMGGGERAAGFGLSPTFSVKHSTRFSTYLRNILIVTCNSLGDARTSCRLFCL